jgi:transcription antitermination factor NusG
MAYKIAHADTYQASGQKGLHHPPPPRLVDPAPIQFEGVKRWVVAICKPNMAISVGHDLNSIGFRSYCPLGRRIVYRGRTGGKVRARRIHQFAVFGRYLFVGEVSEPLAAYVHEGLVDVIGDSQGAWPLNPLVLEAINAAELAGHWNQRDPDRAFSKGEKVKIAAGPFAGFEGFVLEGRKARIAAFDGFALECSKAGVKVGLNLFGRQTSTTVKPEALELV